MLAERQVRRIKLQKDAGLDWNDLRCILLLSMTGYKRAFTTILRSRLFAFHAVTTIEPVRE
jgi:hypothetical protein